MTQEPQRPKKSPLPPTHDTTGTAADSHLATSVIAYLLSGPITFGGLGFLLDWWLGTSFLVPVGIIAGMTMSIYVIWLRYGSQ
ncbi:hypothetical protein [Ornithinimicrobium sp. INDO-MA30-4]|uniref:hypothetical protein n=1 Tax=Ornithinimicrobium sp. INDO-MA30-4 TaxID=2908651 RepID=UPI001F36E493|nr:hypothetical protein [Ornithinimicrobium sp. INDO-MA30-4]UJH70635.1 hypothetical protein L0A91_00505 [Ornithinimicrobium sp. INDO-MA30-4]